MSLKQLWAPWRMDFITGDKKSAGDSGCVFCDLAAEKDDRKNLILLRTKRVFVILNKYPYNNGHLMVVPFTHVGELTELPDQDVQEMNVMAKRMVQVLKEAYRPEGFNLGMNLGISAGAGIKDHVHLHVVPRWIGDSNFMPVLADTKSMPQHLTVSYDQILAATEKSGIKS